MGLFPGDFSSSVKGTRGAAAQLHGDLIRFSLRHLGRPLWSELSLIQLDNSHPPSVSYVPFGFEACDSLVEEQLAAPPPLTSTPPKSKGKEHGRAISTSEATTRPFI